MSTEKLFNSPKTFVFGGNIVWTMPEESRMRNAKQIVNTKH